MVGYRFRITRNEIIHSVLGFNLDAEIKYKDFDGSEKPILTTFTTIPYTGTELPKVGTSQLSDGFFTNYNFELLQKIRDYQRNNI